MLDCRRPVDDVGATQTNETVGLLLGAKPTDNEFDVSSLTLPSSAVPVYVAKSFSFAFC